MKTIQEILKNVETISIVGNSNRNVSHITADSRQAQNEWIFVAVRGTQTDGHLYIKKAVENGCQIIVCEDIPIERTDNITYIQVKNSGVALAKMATNFYDEPSKNLKLVGVTGTNGKTTIATLLFQLFRRLGYSAGLLSTVENRIDDEVIAATHTTPDPIELNQLLNKMVYHGCEYCFMEVSSHAIDQQRIGGLEFTGGIFTNITHDHLDYHKTFANYLAAKKRFFDDLPDTAFALSNLDDRNGKVMLQNCKANKYYYSLQTLADFKCKISENQLSGLILTLNDKEAYFRLTGKFNAYNLTAIYGAAVCLGADSDEVLKEMSLLKPVDGRFETIVSTDGITAIVDYAHTPDALKNVLETINELRTHNEQVITVAGCGGDRDKTKRPEMAAVCCNMSDRVILTSDNPRTEDPEVILDEMTAGVPIELKRKVLRISNRHEAIKTAVALAKSGDVILIAGKGHEKYQDILGVKHHFDDKEEIRKNFGMEV
ncbi:MAG: UDP-N-acetylmuramoyl-L-alanyl-D-glutamate--2,6-diaminopimelate ligase [Bacteroidales bacterium]|nr:UDP-N-acetylmuramoyl-L-alanyl-D-glutamate--2,6-diaminopimelate ligase [Bacteroidales bacterium]